MGNGQKFKSVSTNKVSLECSPTPSFMYFLWLLSCWTGGLSM